MEANVNVSFHTNATQLTFDCVNSHILAFKYYLCLKKINILDSPLHRMIDQQEHASYFMFFLITSLSFLSIVKLVGLVSNIK